MNPARFSWLIVLLIVVALVALPWALGPQVKKWIASAPPKDPNEPVVENAPELPPIYGPQPQAVADETEYYFGAMQHNDKDRHTFQITNKGEYPLELRMGSTTCKCTISNLEKNSVPPGETVGVTLEWTAKSTEDYFRQEATILTNDRIKPRIVFRVEGAVTNPLVLTPSSLVIDSMGPTETRSGSAKLFSRFKEDLEITGFELADPTTSQSFQIDHSPLPAEELAKGNAKKGFLITVTAKPGLPLGAFRQKITFQLNYENIPTIDLPVEGNIQGEISILGQKWKESQKALELGTISPNKGVTHQLTIFVRGEKRNELVFEPPQVQPQWLKVKVGERTVLKDGEIHQYPLTIQVPPGSPQGNYMGPTKDHMGQVLIPTNIPEYGNLKLNVKFLILP